MASKETLLESSYSSGSDDEEEDSVPDEVDSVSFEYSLGC